MKTSNSMLNTAVKNGSNLFIPINSLAINKFKTSKIVSIGVGIHNNPMQKIAPYRAARIYYVFGDS